MGSFCECCKKNNYDFCNLQIQKERKLKNSSSIDCVDQTNYVPEINDLQQINANKKEAPKYISNKKLKLTIKQSKCLLEGKEYIINSSGLLDSTNKYKDGLTIFGDINVIKK